MFGSVPAAIVRAAGEVREVGRRAGRRRSCRGSRGTSRTAPVSNDVAAALRVGRCRLRRRRCAGAASQRSNSSGGSATTTKRHVRVLEPAELGALAAIDARLVGASHSVVVAARESGPSCRARFGTQKLWMTSFDLQRRCTTGRPTGMCSSLAVVTREHGSPFWYCDAPPPLVAGDLDLERRGFRGSRARGPVRTLATAARSRSDDASSTRHADTRDVAAQRRSGGPSTRRAARSPARMAHQRRA